MVKLVPLQGGWQSELGVKDSGIGTLTRHATADMSSLDVQIDNEGRTVES